MTRLQSVLGAQALLLVVLLGCVVNYNFALERESSADNKHVTSAVEHDDVETDVFLPTDEWQEIKPGQAIPGGLHVKMDLQTGKKMAKLLGKDDETGAISSVSDLQDAGQLAVVASESQDNSSRPKVYLQRRTQVEILLSDMEKLATSLDSAESSDQDETPLLECITGLEWEVQDIDKAEEFMEIGGLDLVLDLLGRFPTSPNIQGHLMWLIGTSVKQSATLRTSAFQKGLLGYAAKAFFESSRCEEETSDFVVRKSLYCVGSILRGSLQVESLALSDLPTSLDMLSKGMKIALHDGRCGTAAKTKVLALLGDMHTSMIAYDSEAMKAFRYSLADEGLWNTLLESLIPEATAEMHEKLLRGIIAINDVFTRSEGGEGHLESYLIMQRDAIVRLEGLIQHWEDQVEENSQCHKETCLAGNDESTGPPNADYLADIIDLARSIMLTLRRS